MVVVSMAWRLLHQLNFRTIKSLLKDETLTNIRCFATTAPVYVSNQEINAKLILKDRFFEQETKNKETFLDLLEVFKTKNYKTGHIEFIYAALNRMDEYGVDEDLECYKQIVDVMPKAKMMATNSWLADFNFYPKHQHCIVDVLSKMEEKRVMPDRDMYELLCSIFGKKSSPTLKVMRMLYWMPKLKYASPWPPPVPRPKDQLETAVLAVKRMCSVDPENEVTVFQTKDDDLCLENTWIVNGQSPIQRTLLNYHPENLPIFIEGCFKMYLGQKNTADYVVLRADMPKNRRRKKIPDPDDIRNLKIPLFDPPTPEDLIPDFSVHEQRDGIIYAIASIGSLNKETVQSWIRLLQLNGNPKLAKIPVVFRCTFPENQQPPLKLPKLNEEESKEIEENN